MNRVAQRRIDEIIKRELFRVDRLACQEAARRLQPSRVGAVLQSRVRGSSAHHITYKAALVGICHQINWDFLNARLGAQLLPVEEKELISFLTSVDARQVAEWLKGYRKPERIRAPERAMLLRDIGAGLRERGWNGVSDLVTVAKGTIAGIDGFVSQLNIFMAYREDPLRKKSYVLIQELEREGLVSFCDAAEIEPAIDYHIMRLYLRSGRVVPLYPEVASILSDQPRPRPRVVTLLRQAVADALRTTAFYAGLSVPQVNYIEWQIGRAICVRGRPLCVRRSLPIRVDAQVAALIDDRCPYSAFCKAYSDEAWRKLKEPNFVSSLY